MKTKEELLGCINNLFAQNEGFDSVEEALHKDLEMVVLEFIDLVCEKLDVSHD
jgi:hypothetical protein